MPNVILADTSTLILLKNIQYLDLLKAIYQEIYITPEIQAEYGESLPKWIQLCYYENENLFQQLNQDLGIGEASAITYAVENPETLLILDDLKARKTAIQLELNITVILGILATAKSIGLIPNVKPFLEKLKAINFRLSKQLESDFLHSLGE